MMYICLIGLLFAAFHVTCDGFPERLVPALKLPADVAQEQKLVEKRVPCTEGQLDKYPSHCVTWEKSGLCSGIYEAFMQTNCYASCNKCEVPPTTPPPPTPPPKVDEDACLAAHNAKRALHQNTNPLTWNHTLAQHAKAWADHLIATNKFDHDQSVNGLEGENLYRFSSSTVSTCTAAVEYWYDEIKDYNYDDPGFGEKTGHFTQVVWKGTTQVGAGLAKKVNSKGNTITIVVARYSPPGNYRGQFAENVAPEI